MKVVASEEKIDGGNTNKYMSAGAAVEFKPVQDSIYRYHAAYNYRTMTSDDEEGGALDGGNVQEVIVGMRILADFLK
ncbi:hypothetical protein D3C87_1571870 [compost metagenome]